jgi:hypothetical protein
MYYSTQAWPVLAHLRQDQAIRRRVYNTGQQSAGSQRSEANRAGSGQSGVRGLLPLHLGRYSADPCLGGRSRARGRVPAETAIEREPLLRRLVFDYPLPCALHYRRNRNLTKYQSALNPSRQLTFFLHCKSGQSSEYQAHKYASAAQARFAR